MGNMCNMDTRDRTGEHGALLSRPSNLLLFSYGEDAIHPLVEHTLSQSIFNDTKFKDILLPILERLVEEKRMYKDPEYLTQPLLLKSQNILRQCKWVRPSKFIGSGDSYVILKETRPDSITVNDEVVQYFGVFLIMLSKNPELIERAICLRPNTFGLNVVRMFLHGTERFILIDDEVLCDDRSTPIFTPHERNQAWPMLIEKCWMKVLGPISEIENLRPEQPIEDFLGVPSRTVPLQNGSPQQIVRQISHRRNEKEFFCFTSKLNPPEMVGLSGGKHFALLANFNVDGTEFFLLRNPLGKFEYRGNYAFPTTKQLSALRQTGITDLKPGNFIVDSEQIIEQFESYTVSFYQPSYIVSAQEFQCKRNTEVYFRFFVKTGGPISLRVHQINVNGQMKERFFPFMIDLMHVESCSLIADGSEESYWGGRNIDFFDEVMRDIRPGTYIARLKPKWLSPEAQRTAAFLAYFHTEVEFEMSDQQRYAMELNKVLKLEAERMLQEDRKVHGEVAYQIKWFKNRVILYLRNMSKRRKSLKVELDFPSLQNLECVSHDISKLKSATVDIQDNLMVVFEKISLTEETAIKQYFINAY